MLRGDLNWTEIHGRGDTFIHTAVSPCCTAATDITMYSNNTPIKKKKGVKVEVRDQFGSYCRSPGKR